MTVFILALIASSGFFSSVLQSPAVSVGRESPENAMVEICSGVAVSPSHAVTLNAFTRNSTVFILIKGERNYPDSVIHFRDMGLSMLVFSDTLFQTWEQPRNSMPLNGAALLVLSNHPTGFSAVRTFPMEQLNDGALLLASSPSSELMGAPVFDSSNMLAGIITGSFDPGDGRGELMALIPCNLWYFWVETLLADAGMGRPPFGITAMPATSGLSAVQGILILDVQRNSAAENCGLLQGDIITVVNGERVFHPEALKVMVQNSSEELFLTVQRDSETTVIVIPER
ncbi:MAG: PDZ domain-containing protein [Candidatus Neomarinimicrobiota bacterium]|jgi:hypothetical protein